MPIEINNYAFSFRCPLSGESLVKTDDPDVSYCELCKENVYSCATAKELKAAVKLGRCVEIQSPCNDVVMQNIQRGRIDSSSLDQVRNLSLN